MVFESFDKNIPGRTDKYELYKPVIRKFNKRKVQPPIEDIWGSDIADI